MAGLNQVPKLYKTVVDDVINNVREAFLDDGVDEQVLQELKQLWENKLLQSKALDPIIPDQDHLLSSQYTMLTHQSTAQAQTGAGKQRIVTAPLPTIPVPLQITGTGAELSSPATTATMALPSGLFQHQLAALNAGGITLRSTGNGHYIAVPNIPQPSSNQVVTSTITLPQTTTLNQGAAATNQVHHQAAQQQSLQSIIQLDGANDTSSDDDDEYENDDNDDENDYEQNEEENEDQGEEEEPLNSEDDVSDEEDTELFDTDNVVVCQYDKINRNKNKWKFHLKDGIMNLNGKDYVFQKACGDADW